MTILTILNGCIFSDSNRIAKRWSFEYANAPIIRNMASSIEHVSYVIPYKQVFVGSKFILRDDKSFDCVLFENYTHGHWQYDEENQQLFLTPDNQKQSMRLSVDSMNNNLLQVRIDSLNFIKWKNFKNPANTSDGWFTHNRQVIFRFAPDVEKYTNPEKDPYDILTNRWRTKPTRPESDKEIKQRVKEHLIFYKLLFDDAYYNDKTYVTYNWFVSPVLPATNGIALKNYSKIKQGWESCFYDSVQAFKGFQLLSTAFSKHLEYPEKIDNKFKRESNMIGQLLQNME